MAGLGSREKLQRLIEERQLVGYTNDTRWRELFAELDKQGLRSCLSSRLKWLFQEELTAWSFWNIPVAGYIEYGDLGPIAFREIEWLEIDAVEHRRVGALIPDRDKDRSGVLEEVCKQCRVALSVNDTVFRIWGYKSPSP